MPMSHRAPQLSAHLIMLAALAATPADLTRGTSPTTGMTFPVTVPTPSLIAHRPVRTCRATCRNTAPARLPKVPARRAVRVWLAHPAPLATHCRRNAGAVRPDNPGALLNTAMLASRAKAVPRARMDSLIVTVIFQSLLIAKTAAAKPAFGLGPSPYGVRQICAA